MVKYVSPAELPVSEDQFQTWLVDAARYCGWLTFFVPNWMYRLAMRDMRLQRRSREWGDAGFPDVWLVHPERGQLLVFELKSAKGTVRAEQKTWIAALQKAGVNARVVRPKDRDEIERLLQGE